MIGITAAAFEAIRHGFHSATLASSMIPTTKASA